MLAELLHEDCLTTGLPEAWAGLCNGAGYGAASTELGEGAWLCSVVFAHATSKVVESLLHAAGVEGVQLRQGWLCPGAARDFFPVALCFH